MELNNQCTEFPCYHEVSINGSKKSLYGIEIYNHMVDNKMEIPKHFKHYGIENDIEISDECIEAFPCSHRVSITKGKNSTTTMMTGIDIYKYLVQHNFDIPEHFEKYKSDNKEFEIDDVCYESYPCQHYVKIKGKRQMIDGVKIYKYCKDNNITVPRHFEGYAEFTSNKFFD